MYKICQKNNKNAMKHNVFTADKINTDQPWVTKPGYTPIQLVIKKQTAKV